MTNTLPKREEPLAVRGVFCHKSRAATPLARCAALSNTDYTGVDMPMPFNGTNARRAQDFPAIPLGDAVFPALLKAAGNDPARLALLREMGLLPGGGK